MLLISCNAPAGVPDVLLTAYRGLGLLDNGSCGTSNSISPMRRNDFRLLGRITGKEGKPLE